MDEFDGEAPGRLGERLRGSLSGHHPLFDIEDIRGALARGNPDAPPIDPAHADEVGQTLIALAQDGFGDVRSRVDSLSPAAREGLIRLYFRLLSRAREVRGRVH
jgi:hypothetical protein